MIGFLNFKHEYAYLQQHTILKISVGLNDFLPRKNSFFRGSITLRVGQHKERKTRIDKKKEVKATLPVDLKDAIYRISYITLTPVKDICEHLCHSLVSERKTIDKLSKNFIRSIIYDDTIFRGHHDNPQINKRIPGKTTRVTIKFKRPDYEAIYNLSYALDLSPSRVVAVLLELAMSDITAVNQYIKDYLQRELPEYQMKELKLLLKYMNRTNTDHQSWASFLSYIYDEKGSPMLKMKEIITEYLNDK